MQGVLGRLGPGRISVRPFIIGMVLAAFLAVTYFWRLGTLTAGLGPHEYMTRQSSQSLKQIYEHGVYAPYYLLTHVSLQASMHQVFFLRLVSVLLGFAVFYCLYKLLTLGFGRAVAIFTGLIFVTTPWLMVGARSAEPLVMWHWPVVVVALFVWCARKKDKPVLPWFLLCLSVAVALYIPGLVWLLPVGLIFGRKQFSAIFTRLGRLYVLAGLALALLMLFPLIQAFVSNPAYIKQILLTPAKLPAIAELAKSIGWSFAGLFWRTQSHIDIGIGRLPLLNIIQVALCVFGAYALYVKSRKLMYFLGGLVAFAALLSGLNQKPEILLLALPAVIIFLAAGIRYLYLEWRRVFPHNPFARAMALALISTIVAMQMLYGLRYSLVAWPHTEATKTVYVLK